MSEDQSTSKTVEPVTDGQSDTLVSVTKNYPGGKEGLELARSNPNFRKKVWEVLDQLADEQILCLSIIEQPIWRTIKLCTGLKTGKEFVKAIEETGGQVDNWARDILSKGSFTVANQPTEIDLIIVSVAELGFPGSATFKQIYDRAQSLGLSLCPEEVGPQLRKQYMDQPKDEWLLIAMKPIITDSDDISWVFNVGHDDDDNLWLGTRCGYPGTVLSGRYRLVFWRQQK